MNVKEFLSQAHHIDRKISHQLDQLASIREFTTKAGNVLSDMPKGDRNYKLMEQNIATMIDLEQEIDNDMKYLLYLKKTILLIIKNTDNSDYRTLLELRYLHSKKWNEIKSEISKAEDNYNKILQSFQFDYLNKMVKKKKTMNKIFIVLIIVLLWIF